MVVISLAARSSVAQFQTNLACRVWLQKPKVDISAIMEDLRGIIDVMVETVPQSLVEQKRSQYDLAGIDFERLRVEFAKSAYKDTAMRTLQARFTREGLCSEKELPVFDLLSKDKVDLSKNAIAKIKAVVVALMANISDRQAQMIRLQDRASAQAQSRNLIIKQMLAGMSEGFSSGEIELRAIWVYHHLGNTAQPA